MYAAKRPLLKPVILLLILASFILAACSGQVQNVNWPGLSAEGNTVYLAHGPKVIAYDVADQSEVWSFPAERSSAQYYAAPATDENGVVIGDFGASGGMFSPKVIVHVLSLQEQPTTPATIWEQSEQAADKIVASPLIVGNRVFVGTADSEVFALDRETGAPLWDAPFTAGSAIWGQPAFADDTLYVASLDGNVYALDPGSGAVLGQWETSGAIAGSPIVDGDFIYVGSFDSKLHALNRQEFGSEVWFYETPDWVWGAPTVVEGIVYFGDLQGNAFAVDAETGSLVWQKSVTGPVQTSPVAVDGTIYFASQGDVAAKSGQLTAFAADGGAQLWQQSAPAFIYTTPVVVGDAIVVALQGSADLLLAGYSRESGAQQWTFTPAAQ
ncbi:MAG: PQQ-like beta-propeller repeat protein [Ardenticatenaceae bacterium]|nr:PQQ-like beta-propeller repeat protein [Ardenticatenaceae bacterium]